MVVFSCHVNFIIMEVIFFSSTRVNRDGTKNEQNVVIATSTKSDRNRLHSSTLLTCLYLVHILKISEENYEAVWLFLYTISITQGDATFKNMAFGPY